MFCWSPSKVSCQKKIPAKFSTTVKKLMLLCKGVLGLSVCLCLCMSITVGSSLLQYFAESPLWEETFNKRFFNIYIHSLYHYIYMQIHEYRFICVCVCIYMLERVLEILCITHYISVYYSMVFYSILWSWCLLNSLNLNFITENILHLYIFIKILFSMFIIIRSLSSINSFIQLAVYFF